MSPDVSVVVIVHDDADRLPRAVRSVLTQTLHSVEVVVVDDCSTDRTPEVLDELCRLDPRVRRARTPQNSGGCGAPRNLGVQLARAERVMFLDSDDELERHAAKNLLLEAEVTGADVVCGRVDRVFAGSSRVDVWKPYLYRARGVFAGIAARPHQIDDTLAVNKLYPRRLLAELPFPEDIHYEDLVFTAAVYCRIASFAVTPQLVYRWHVDRAADQLSITNRRTAPGNLEHRLLANRRVRAVLDAGGAAGAGPDVSLRHADRLLRHDLRLYLLDLPAVPAGRAAQVVALIADTVATLPRDALRRLPALDRVAYALALDGDVGGVLDVVAALRHSNALTAPLRRVDGRLTWGADPPRDRSLEPLLDVTDLRLDEIPFAQRGFRHVVDDVQARPGALEISGHTVDALGDLPTVVHGAELVVQALPDDGELVVPLSWRPDPAARVARWHGRLGHPWPDPPDRPAARWTVRLRLHDAAGRVNERPVGAGDAGSAGDAGALPAPGAPGGSPAARLTGVRGRLPGPLVAADRTRHGNLVLRRVDVRRAGAAGLLDEADRWRRRLATAAAGPAREIDRAGTRATTAVARRMPLRSGLAVFESQLGGGCLGSPRQVFEAARRLRPDLTVVWAYREGLDPAAMATFPDGVRLVRRGSAAYRRALERAEYWVDDQGFPFAVGKRLGTRYLQTWHGTPLKRMGFDEPGLRRAGRRRQQAFRRAVARWDLLVSPSPYFDEVFLPAVGYRGEVLRYGTPRNDPLVTRADPATRAALRARLEIPEGTLALLYAPTFRTTSAEPVPPPFDLDPLEELAGSVVLLCRPHYLNRFRLPTRFSHLLHDVSGVPDVTDLHLASDGLVTDYSSVMFDYAVLDRPMIFYAYDYARYTRDTRGTYLALDEIAPGPLVTDTAGLVDAIGDVLAGTARWQQRMAAFRQRFCAYEDGTAAERVARRTFLVDQAEQP